MRTLPEHGRLLVLGCFLSVSPSCFAIDGDGDGVTPADGDCDDSDPYVYADAPGRCDGVDNDCDGVTDTYCGRLSVGWDHACAIAPSGEVVCYGLARGEMPHGKRGWTLRIPGGKNGTTQPHFEQSDRRRQVPARRHGRHGSSTSAQGF